MTSVGEDVEKTAVHCWWQKLAQALWKIVWRFLKSRTTKDLAIPLWVFSPEKTKPLIRKDTCLPMFIAALLTVGNIWKLPECPADEQRKMWYIMHSGMLAIKEKSLVISM